KYPNQSAALTAIEAVAASAQIPFSEGLDYESQLVNQAKQSAECRGSIHLFSAERATAKIPGIDASEEAMPIESAAIIGAGTMGGGIAMCFAHAGIPVTLIDVSEDGLQRGLNTIDANYASRVKRGRMSEAEKAATMALITGSLSMGSVADADLVIEAVFEDMDLKQSIFKTLDEKAKPEAILATNTSTLDIDRIGEVTSMPARV